MYFFLWLGRVFRGFGVVAAICILLGIFLAVAGLGAIGFLIALEVALSV